MILQIYVGLIVNTGNVFHANIYNHKKSLSLRQAFDLINVD
jgi:hypothetical protein